MNFRPGDEKRRLRDTWALVRDVELHLFYLTNPAPDPDGRWQSWDGIGHAVSRNLLDWEERETVTKRGGIKKLHTMNERR